MVNTLSGSVCAYRKETVKPRFIRIDEVMALLDVTQDEAMDIALAAGARYQLAKIILVHKERLMKFMKHSARVPSSNKIVEKKFVRIGEGSMTYSIGHHRFIEMARAAGAVYKIGEAKGNTILINLEVFDEYMEQFREPPTEMKHPLSLELFVNGSLNIFNHQTNVDVDNRFTVYGIRDLGTELSPITMLVMMESIQNRIVENGKRGKATWLYIDEFHVLLNSEYSAKYLQQLWKKVRKQGGLCTGITQNVVDLLQNYTATTMLANSEFVALLKQANTDSSKMAEVIGVSEAQLRFVTNTASGMGLIKCGSVVIPFDNQISKDTDLYRLYNTNIHEKIAEQKKKEAMLQ